MSRRGSQVQGARALLKSSELSTAHGLLYVRLPTVRLKELFRRQCQPFIPPLRSPLIPVPHLEQKENLISQSSLVSLDTSSRHIHPIHQSHRSIHFCHSPSPYPRASLSSAPSWSFLPSQTATPVWTSVCALPQHALPEPLSRTSRLLLPPFAEDGTSLLQSISLPFPRSPEPFFLCPSFSSPSLSILSSPSQAQLLHPATMFSAPYSPCVCPSTAAALRVHCHRATSPPHGKQIKSYLAPHPQHKGRTL